jgi:hypothetical protein
MTEPAESSRATVVVSSPKEQELEMICDHLIDKDLMALPFSTGLDASRLCRYGRAEVLVLTWTSRTMPRSSC